MSELTAIAPYDVLQPGAYSSTNMTALAAAATGALTDLPAVLGVSEGGKPAAALAFRNVATAQNVLRGGPLFDSVRLALIAGAPQVLAVRVGNAITQASLKLEGETGDVVKITARDWGEWANAVTVTVKTGPIVAVSYTNPVTGAVYTQEWNLKSLMSPTNAQIAQAINGELAPFRASPLVSASAEAGTGALKVASAKPLAGGTNGTAPTAENWTEGLTALETVNATIIVAATSDKTVHAQVAEHCNLMSTPQAKMERTAVYGGASGESEEEAATRISELPYARAQLVWPEQYLPNIKGELTLYDPFYVAAMVAGMHAAQTDVGTSLVHKLTPAIEPGRQLSTIPGGNIDVLLEKRVMPLAPAPGGGVWVVDDLSGYTGTDGIFRDFITIREADYVARALRNAVEPFIGGKALHGSTESLQARAEAALKELVGVVIREFRTPTVELGPNQTPNITPSNSYSISAPVVLIGVDKYIFISVGLQAPGAVSA